MLTSHRISDALRKALARTTSAYAHHAVAPVAARAAAAAPMIHGFSRAITTPARSSVPASRPAVSAVARSTKATPLFPAQHLAAMRARAFSTSKKEQFVAQLATMTDAGLLAYIRTLQFGLVQKTIAPMSEDDIALVTTCLNAESERRMLSANTKLHISSTMLQNLSNKLKAAIFQNKGCYREAAENIDMVVQTIITAVINNLTDANDNGDNEKVTQGIQVGLISAGMVPIDSIKAREATQRLSEIIWKDFKDSGLELRSDPGAVSALSAAATEAADDKIPRCSVTDVRLG